MNSNVFKKNKLSLIFLSITFFNISACSTIDKCTYQSPAKLALSYKISSSLTADENNYYQLVKSHIKTNKDGLFHSAVLNPEKIVTDFPFYFIGIEKPAKGDQVSPYCNENEEDCKGVIFAPMNFIGGSNDDHNGIVDTQNDIQKNIFKDSRSLVVTHILKVKNQNQEPTVNCFIYNVYGDKSYRNWCKLHQVTDYKKFDWKRDGWKGLDQLGVNISDEAKDINPTHIILMATGWNTRQYESYLDFKAWMDNLKKNYQDKNEEFRPIFIGTSWQSEWPFWERLPFLSQFTKGNDADEIGFTWQNYLLNDVVKPIAKETNAKVIVIGHSFGARIALGSQYTKSIIVRKTPQTDSPVTIIGMQAAFPINRFISAKGKEHHYIKVNKGNSVIAITSSQYDTATGLMCIGTAYVGAGCGIKKVQEETIYKDAITVEKVREDGSVLNLPNQEKVTLYDASKVVGCELEGTSSGAHSDVYDPEMANLISNIMRGK